MFETVSRWFQTRGRTSAWNKADHDYRAAHSTCEMCNIGKQIEAHDVLPYHTLNDIQKNDYNFLMTNLISLCHQEHRQIAHCGDPKCLKYNNKIREIARTVESYRQYCTL
jgi:hypothetical protein